MNRIAALGNRFEMGNTFEMNRITALASAVKQLVCLPVNQSGFPIQVN